MVWVSLLLKALLEMPRKKLSIILLPFKQIYLNILDPSYFYVALQSTKIAIIEVTFCSISLFGLSEIDEKGWLINKI